MDRIALSSIALIVAAFALAAIFYGRLPERVPVHWNADGLADHSIAKPWGPFVLPLVMTGVLVLLRMLPHISPRGYEMEPFLRSYEALQLGFIAFLFLVNLGTLLDGLGFAIPMPSVLAVGLGLLLTLIGNFSGKLTTNFFVGIRTPWTLADPEVWLRTHRLAGKLFVGVGFAIMVCGLLGVPSVWLFAAALLVSLAPAAYSYVAYIRSNAPRTRA